MNPIEAKLMTVIFSPEILSGNEQAILAGSYRYGKDHYCVESTEFLKRKAEAYQKEQ